MSLRSVTGSEGEGCVQREKGRNDGEEGEKESRREDGAISQARCPGDKSKTGFSWG